MSNRHKCTKEDPYVDGKHDRAYHPDAYEELDLGEVVRYRCPNCNISWKEELPQ